jgi:hypothetical protein
MRFSLLQSDVGSDHSGRGLTFAFYSFMPIRCDKPHDRVILQMKASGASFSEIANAMSSTIGSVTGRYYRLKGVRHRSQIIRDLQLKDCRRAIRAATNRRKSVAAIEAAIAIHRGCNVRSAVDAARTRGASFAMIGACLGVSGQALHKMLRKY